MDYSAYMNTVTVINSFVEKSNRNRKPQQKCLRYRFS